MAFRRPSEICFTSLMSSYLCNRRAPRGHKRLITIANNFGKVSNIITDHRLMIVETLCEISTPNLILIKRSNKGCCPILNRMRFYTSFHTLLNKFLNFYFLKNWSLTIKYGINVFFTAIYIRIKLWDIFIDFRDFRKM